MVSSERLAALSGSAHPGASLPDWTEDVMRLHLGSTTMIIPTIQVAVECKSHLSVDDVDEHLDRLAQFKSCFPQYRDYQLLGAVAGRVVPDQVGRLAYQKGLFAVINLRKVNEISWTG